MKRKWIYAAILAATVLLVSVPSLRALWVDGGIPVCERPGDQLNVAVLEDGAGGAFVFWTDQRSGNGDIYAQRIDAVGDSLWTPGGVSVCTDTSNQQRPELALDGSGGVVAVWKDFRYGGANHLFAQRLDSFGNALWRSDGAPVCTLSSVAEYYVAPDGGGGAIVAWSDYRATSYQAPDIVAQRIDGTGAIRWAVDGVILSDPRVAQEIYAGIAPDDSGGAVVVWTNYPDNLAYAQRLDANGNELWTSGGITLSTSPASWGMVPRIVRDGSDGHIVAWHGSGDVYAQRVDAAGNLLWGTGAALVCVSSEYQADPELVSDTEGGAVFAWRDSRNSFEYDIYAQRLDPSGNRLWAADGVAITTAADYQQYYRLVPDGSGGAILCWADDRDASLVYPDHHVYAQRVDGDGNVLWTPDGVAVQASQGCDWWIRSATDGVGGAFIVWADKRNTLLDVFALRLGPDGTWGFAPRISAVADVPKDQGGKVILQWQGSNLDVLPLTEVTHYSAWRRLPAMSSSLGRVMPEGANFLQPGSLDIPVDFEGPAVRLTAEGYAWEWLANVPSHYFETYALLVVSLYDSMGTDPGWQTFMVSAQTADPTIFYDSAVDSGYSVDNLSPGAPMGLAATAVFDPAPGLLLTWYPNPEPDCDHYAVYRGSSEGFVPGPGSLMAATADTCWMDVEWNPEAGFFYKVAAVDVHGNEGQRTMLGEGNVTGAGDSGIPEVDFLAQNVPNPFNPATRISFGVSRKAAVSLAIYDVSGRLVRMLVEGPFEAGSYVRDWDGKDASGREVSSGVYFYRLTVGEETLSKKMQLIR
jgi:hypothetical protein